MKRDIIFQQPAFSEGSFKFDQSVVQVFDDMIGRSVPFYTFLTRAIATIIVELMGSRDHFTVYDLGASTGNLLSNLDQQLLPYQSLHYYGIDNSEFMLKELLKKAQEFKKGEVTAQVHDLNNSFVFEKVDVIVLNLVLQFLKEDRRQQLLKNCFDSLPYSGACLVIEKCRQTDLELESLFIKNYHDYKVALGYSDQEIKNKDNAIKGVLVPLTIQRNIDMLQEAGFTTVVPFYQWFNFVGFLAKK